MELDLEHYVVPAPSASGHHVYAANMTETPRSLSLSGVFTNSDGSSGSSYTFKDSGIPVDRPATKKVYLVTSSAIVEFLLASFSSVRVLCCTSIYLLLASCYPVSTWSEQLC